MISPISRRDWLSTVGCGFGSLALAGLASQASAGANPHPVPRAKRIIFPIHARGREPCRFVRLQA